MQNILIISPEKWDHVHVSKHHYAKFLAKRGHKVCFLGPPGRSYGKTIINRYLILLDYRGFIRGFKYFPNYLRQVMLRAVIRKLEKLAGVSFDIIWSFDNSVFFDFDAFKEKFCISHIVDLNQNFNTAKAANSADLCIGVSNHIVKKLSNYNRETYFINHGYNNVIPSSKEIELPGIHRKKVIYIGNLSMAYIDWEIILIACKKITNVDFIFIGSNAENFDESINSHHGFKKEVYSLNHTYFPGKIDPDLILDYCQLADALMVSYQEKHHIDQANPHKILEYLASGKPIVATYTEQYSYLNDEIAMSTSNSEWVVLLIDVLENGERWNKPELISNRKKISKKNEYQQQIDQISALVRKLSDERITL